MRKKSVPGLDYSIREQFLSPADFESLFECTKEEFATWPKWKQTQAKRKAKMF
jgi:hypothetical protein